MTQPRPITARFVLVAALALAVAATACNLSFPDDTGTCAVNCHESGCVVHNCDLPMFCVVTCGDGGLPTQSGDDWICP